jgi:isocitrate/isopropylmalate dehydrogenase
VTRIAVLPGDGIGTEVLSGPLALLRSLDGSGPVEVSGPWPVGASAYADTGEVVPEETLRACEGADVLLLGAVGEHPGADPAAYRKPSALWTLRTHFDLRLSVREVVRPAGGPLVVVRNLLGGAYGDPRTRREGDRDVPAEDRLGLSWDQIAEVARTSCDVLARFPGHRLMSADKANLFATSRLWRAVVNHVADERAVAVEHRYVDRLAYELARDLPPAVIVTEGIFGDILSDVAAARAGSIALCSSASINPGLPRAGRCRGVFEPVHGSAPRRAGLGIVNPTGAYLALAAALESDADAQPIGVSVRRAVLATIRSGVRTYDMPGKNSPVPTDVFSGHVNDAFAANLVSQGNTKKPSMGGQP